MPTAPPAPGRLISTIGCRRDFSSSAASGRPTSAATPGRFDKRDGLPRDFLDARGEGPADRAPLPPGGKRYDEGHRLERIAGRAQGGDSEKKKKKPADIARHMPPPAT